MGFLSQLVGTVVDAVEGATGQNNSDAGNWAEEQAAKVEGSAAAAGEAASEAASDATGFLTLVAHTSKSTLAGWVAEGLEDAGVNMPSRLDLQSIVTLVAEVGAIAAYKVEEKLTRVAGAHVVETAKSIGTAVGRGPQGIKEAIRQTIVDTVDADGRIRQWRSRTSVVLHNTSPREAVEQVVRSSPDGPAAVWNTIKTILRGDKQGHAAGGGIENTARQAEQERTKLMTEVRWVAYWMEQNRAAPGRRGSDWVLPTVRFSRTPQGAELERLSRLALAGQREFQVALSPEAARRLQSATSAGVRSALLCAELQLWLALIRRLASRIPRVEGARGVSPYRQQFGSVPRVARIISGR